MSDQKPKSYSLTEFFKDHSGLSDLPVETSNELSQSRVVEGQLVDDEAKTSPADLTGLPRVSVDGWLSYMDSKPRGFDPVLKDFLLKNPDLLSLEAPSDSVPRIGHPGEAERPAAASPRQWETLSHLVQHANASVTHAETGKEWAFPQILAVGVVNSSLASAITDFAKDNGIKVVGTLSHNATPIESKEKFAEIGQAIEAAKNPADKTRQPRSPSPDEPAL